MSKLLLIEGLLNIYHFDYNKKFYIWGRRFKTKIFKYFVFLVDNWYQKPKLTFCMFPKVRIHIALLNPHRQKQSREVVSFSFLTTESLTLFCTALRIRGACIRIRILIFNPFTGLRIRSREVVSFSSLTTVRNR